MHPMIERPVRLVAYLGVARDVRGPSRPARPGDRARGASRGALALCLPLALVYAFQCLTVWYPVRAVPASRAGGAAARPRCSPSRRRSAAIWTAVGHRLGRAPRQLGRLRRAPRRASAPRCRSSSSSASSSSRWRRCSTSCSSPSSARATPSGAGSSAGARPRGRAEGAQGAARPALPLQQPELGLGAHRLRPQRRPPHVLPARRLLPQEPGARRDARDPARRGALPRRDLPRHRGGALRGRGCGPRIDDRRGDPRASPCRRWCSSRWSRTRSTTASPTCVEGGEVRISAAPARRAARARGREPLRPRPPGLARRRRRPRQRPRPARGARSAAAPRSRSTAPPERYRVRLPAARARPARARA